MKIKLYGSLEPLAVFSTGEESTFLRSSPSGRYEVIVEVDLDKYRLEKMPNNDNIVVVTRK